MTIMVGDKLRTWVELYVSGGDPRIQPASVDLTLGGTFIVPNFIDRRVKSHPEVGTMPAGVLDAVDSHRWTTLHHSVHVIKPGGFCLGTTQEHVEMTEWFTGNVHGKSTLGRNGLFVHITAGLIDPGFKGQITLEFYNASPNPLVIEQGQPICQLQVVRLSDAAELYNGHYQNQSGTQIPWTQQY